MHCSDIKTDGNVRILLEHAEKIIDWWDAQAGMTHDDYVSPKPSLESLGKLQLNVWGENQETRVFYYVILVFDSADPTSVLGGRVKYRTVLSPAGSEGGEVKSGSLQENTNTPVSGDYLLEFVADHGGFLREYEAEVAISLLADGTFDVRGVANKWVDSPNFNGTVEGTGNAMFIVPGQ